ncbi:hypothetical protein FACUT_10865 [Fusarium acutatum]|uniref:Uncharacterized protein n=1 Tax=Fusarium acutatum TaxID=78861 RepID=A0A8H4JIC2_9HYPO|nr:hypothetical protein FACUT_10865 [Fusarium acutatum]
MDPTLDYYRSLLHLAPYERHDRMSHISRLEYNRVSNIVRNEDAAKRLKEVIAGRDLIQVALDDPSEIRGDGRLKNIVLGRTNCYAEEKKMIRRLTNNVASTSSSLIHYVERFDYSSHALTLDAWKLVYCDICYVDGGSSTLQEIYEARLEEEKLQTPAARARELVRDNDLKKARRNAKWMIPALERLSEEEILRPAPEEEYLHRQLYEHSTDKELMAECFKRECHEKGLERIWKQVSPPPPAWIQKIVDSQEEFGFIYYRSREVHFKEYCKENRSKTKEDEQKIKKMKKKDRKNYDDYLSPGFLRNTFIVIPFEFASGNLNIEEGDLYDPCWVWAYDANWDGSEEETVVDGEKYEGRVKVAKWSLNSWFYAARWEGVSLRDMWLKAQQHPDKFWICYIKEFEEWDHEPYV